MTSPAPSTASLGLAGDLVDRVLFIGGTTSGAPVVEADDLGVAELGCSQSHADGTADVAETDNRNARHAHLLSTPWMRRSECGPRTSFVAAQYRQASMQV